MSNEIDPLDPKERLASFCLALLQANFPKNRRFYIDRKRGNHPEIRVRDAFVVARVVSGQTLYIDIGDRTLTAKRFNVVDLFKTAFEYETAIRKRISHQRQQMKVWQKQLDATEALTGLVSQLNTYNGDAFSTPSITFTFPHLPDDMIARVQFIHYKVVKMHGALPFRVTFGNQCFTFEEFSQVLSFFNGNDVFKKLDEVVDREFFHFIDDKHTENTPSSRIIVRRADLALVAPHLILMDATDFEIGNVTLTVEPRASQHSDQTAIARLWKTKPKMSDYVRCIGHRELLWKFDYAPVKDEA